MFQGGTSSAPFQLYWEWTVGVSGIVLAIAWAAASRALLSREHNLATKATELQSRIGVPEEFAPWSRTSSSRFWASRTVAVLLAWTPFFLMWLSLVIGLSASQ